MAWTASGLYVLNWIDLLDATQLAIDTSLTTHKIAMYDNVETPNFSTEVSYSATNEAPPTSVTAYGSKLYADVLVGNNLIVAHNFGGAFTSTAGTFTIQWAATGVFTIDLT